MKLVRLTTTSRDATFSNALPELSIEPNSQIALLNASFDTETEGVIVDETNNTIKLAVNGENNVKSVVLNSNTYNETNFGDLINNFIETGNNQLSYNNNADIGVEMRCIVNKENKIELGHKVSNFLSESTKNNNITKVEVNELSRTNTNTTLVSALASPSGNQSFFYLKESIARGTGQVSLRTLQLDASGGAVGDDGFIFGLTTVDMTTYTGATFDPSQFKIAVKCEADSFPIRVAVDGGAFSATSVDSNPTGSADPVNRDIMSLRVSGGVLQVVAHQSDGSGGQIDTVLATAPYGTKTNLFPVVIFNGASNITKIDKLKYYLSPYGNITSSGDEVEELGAAIKPASRAGATLTNNFIEFTDQAQAFQSLDVARFFGFTQATFPETGFTLSRDFVITAQNQFDATNLSDAYLIELLNIPLTSYDGEVGRKRSILSVIPQTNNNSNGLILYEASTPIFLDIDNNSPMLLRNIEARILKNDNSRLLLRGLASITLLIRPMTERI